MNVIKQERALEVLRVLASEYLIRNSNRTSLITVTRVDASPDMKKATFFLSVLPEDKLGIAVDFAKRRKDDFRDYLKKHSRLHNIPYVTFLPDAEGNGAQPSLEDLPSLEEYKAS